MRQKIQSAFLIRAVDDCPDFATDGLFEEDRESILREQPMVNTLDRNANTPSCLHVFRDIVTLYWAVSVQRDNSNELVLVSTVADCFPNRHSSVGLERHKGVTATLFMGPGYVHSAFFSFFLSLPFFTIRQEQGS